MALILEVLDPRSGGTRTRTRIDRLPLTIGRSLENDVILEDPYADPRHARIVLDEAGALLIEDLGSSNGLRTSRSERVSRIAVHAGLELRLGRTIVRFRDSAEEVPPALLDTGAPLEGPPGLAWWPRGAGGQVTLVAAAVVSTVLYSWLNEYDRTSLGDLVLEGVGFAVLFGAWAGAWAVGSRIAVQRFHFLPHLAITSLGALAGLLVSVAVEWSDFLVPDSTVLGVLQGATGFALVAGLIAMHLAYASNKAAWRRWRAGLVASAVLLGVGGVASLADDDFGTQADFSAVLKPVPAALVVTTDTDGFLRAAEDLKQEVDEDLEADLEE